VDSFGTDAPNGTRSPREALSSQDGGKQLRENTLKESRTAGGDLARVALGSTKDDGNAGKRSAREGVKRRPEANEPIASLPRLFGEDPEADDNSTRDGRRG